MAFKEYFGMFMKLFLDDFSIFSDLKTHLAKFWLCFDKCQEFGISLNLEKCMFLVFSSVILGYIMSKEGKLPDPKKIATIVNMKPWKTFKFSTTWLSFTDVSSGTSLSSWPWLQNRCEKPKFFNGLLNVNMRGRQSSIGMCMHRSLLHQGGI
jgi:hypothetical protein